MRVGGLVTAVKNYTDRKGETMAFVTLEDLDGTMEVTIFSKLFKTVAPLRGRGRGAWWWSARRT